jgi:4-hydroxybenzoate-CoA ligase
LKKLAAASKNRAGVRVIAAFVVLRTDCAPPDAAELLAFAAETLADYKRPRVIFFRDALPHTPNGKVQKAALESD